MGLMLTEAKLNELKEYFSRQPEVALAFLFGSEAKGTTHAESDVDIGVYFKPATRALEYETDKYYPEEEKIWSDLDKIIGRQVELVVLNRAPVTLFAAVLGEGVKIFCRDEVLLGRLTPAIEDLAEEFVNLVDDFVEIKARSRSLSSADRTRLRGLIDFIRDQLPDFRGFASVTQFQYERDKSIKRNLERCAETLTTALIDVAKILVASAKRPIPRTYKSIVRDLAFLDGFDESTAVALAGFSDLRNLLAHEYLDLRFSLLSKFVKDGEPLYRRLLDFTETFITSAGGKN